MTAEEELRNQMTQAKAMYDRGDPNTFNCFYAIYMKNPDNPYVSEWLGHCYLNGIGVPKNRAQARQWFVFAAQKGDANAAKWLEVCDAPQVPQTPNAGYQNVKSAGSNNIGAMIVALIFCVVAVSTPFFDTIKLSTIFGDLTGSMYQIINLIRNLLSWTSTSDIEFLVEMFKEGGAAAIVAASYIIAVLMFFAAVIELIISIVSLAGNKAKSFWSSTRGAAGAILLIDVIALAWVLVIDNEAGGFVLSFTPWYYLLAVLALVVIIICSSCSRK